jgi:dTDP-4-dehydrorhamnose reductase
MDKILILGANGMLGMNISKALIKEGFTIFQQGRSNSSQFCCNPTKFSELLLLIDKLQPQIIINLIANTNVDNCEIDSENAFISNVIVVENLFRISKKINFHLIHISTDQVYSGSGPHTEENVNPCNVYGITKYTAELIAEKISSSTILRTNFVGKSFVTNRPSFTDWIVSSFKGVEKFTIYDDVLFSALHINDLFSALLKVIEKKTCGTFNLGVIDGISKADFAIKIANKLQLKSSAVIIGSIKNNNLKVKRPLDMRMNVSKFIHTFQHELPDMQQTINQVVLDYL